MEEIDNTNSIIFNLNTYSTNSIKHQQQYSQNDSMIESQYSNQQISFYNHHFEQEENEFILPNQYQFIPAIMQDKDQDQQENIQYEQEQPQNQDSSLEKSINTIVLKLKNYSASKDQSHYFEVMRLKQKQYQANKYNNSKFKRVFYEYSLKNQLKLSKIFQTQRKFYLFSDQVIDIDQLNSFQQNNLNSKQLIQIHKGMRHIHQIIRRYDNKFIEVDLEFYPSNINNIEYLITLVQSLGNKDNIPIINLLQSFWDKIHLCKQYIQKESIDPLLISHFEERKKASDLKYQRIIKQYKSQDMVYLLRVQPVYDKLLYESRKVAYSPKLQEILAPDYQSFQDILKKNGCFDPRSIMLNIEITLNVISSFLQGIINQRDYTSYHVNNIKLLNYFGFDLPVKEITKIINLNEEYDNNNNLSFKFKDLLVLHEFTFTDKNIENQFQQFKDGFYANQQQMQIGEINNLGRVQNYDILQNEKSDFLLKKYYHNKTQVIKEEIQRKKKRKCKFIDVRNNDSKSIK